MGRPAHPGARPPPARRGVAARSRHYVAHKTWTELLADYNVLGGRIWLLVLLTTTAAPYLMGRLELLAILARLDYQITPNATAGFGYRWEDYTIDSFILQGLQNYLPGAILLNPDLGDYQRSAFLLELKLAF